MLYAEPLILMKLVYNYSSAGVCYVIINCCLY